MSDLEHAGRRHAPLRLPATLPAPCLTVAFAVAVAILAVGPLRAGEDLRLPASARNLLVGAETSGNLESFGKGLRGKPDEMIYDPQRGEFLKQSQHHEYGVGFGKDLGVVKEEAPAYWQAEWKAPVRANLISLSGAYPNQPQPETAWKIELRRDGKWTTHARGKGGWYDWKRYVWGGRGTKPLEFDALRVSTFSKDDKTPIGSIHFRGEAGVSWIVADVPPIDATIVKPRETIRAGVETALSGKVLFGNVTEWEWDFGDGKTVEGRQVNRTFTKVGSQTVTLAFSDGAHRASVKARIDVAPPVEARITPLKAQVVAGKAVRFEGDSSLGKATGYVWDFGDGAKGQGVKADHVFEKPGIYKVKLTISDGRYEDEGLAIVRAHSAETLHVPQVLLDTDQKNEQDDQHYFGYGLFSELDLLGINSVHHGGGQEPVNYGEILHVLDLARQSGLPKHREPFIFRGANQRLTPPASRKWGDTEPIVTEACEAILAAARGASPDAPVWVVPVGPGTNAASAILQARREGLELKDRLRVMWLGGSNGGVTGEFNGNNDPWSMYVVGQSDVETWIVPAPVGARVRIDKRTQGHFYADNPLGRYLKKIVPARNKPLFDASCLSSIIGLRLGLDWVKEVERVEISVEKGHKWAKSDAPDAVRVIRQIDEKAMQRDLFDTMKGKATRLIGAPAPKP